MADNFERLQGGSESTTEKTLKKVKAEWRKQWEKELLSDEAVRTAAGKAAFLDRFPDQTWEHQHHAVRASWEGNAAAGIEGALAATDQKGGE